MSTKYSKPFLTQVIFQANYNIPSIKIAVDKSLIKVCTEITNARINEVKNSTVNINFNPNLPITSESNSKWVFEGEEIAIVIQHDFLQILNVKYSNHQTFHAIIENVFNALQECYSPFFSRIALRYINNIVFEEGNTFDYTELIAPELLNGLIKFKEYGLQRSIGQMLMKNDTDDLTTMFTYGFNNSLFPNKISKREFLLDYDCFIIYLNPNEKINSLKETLIKIRSQVNDLFEKSILEGLRNIMNPS